MTVRLIIEAPHPILSQRCKPFLFPGADVDTNSTEALDLAQDLGDTMFSRPNGAGLSAPQIGQLVRVFVIRCAMPTTAPRPLRSHVVSAALACFNPEIIARIGGTQRMSEGCLSYPGIEIKVTRHEAVKVKFQRFTGVWDERVLYGHEAHAFQHELDHLDGRTLPDLIPAKAWAKVIA